MLVTAQILLPKKWWQKPRYRLLKPMECAGFEVPAGFISDGATVPRILWPLFPPVGKYLKATLVHDYLLTQNPHDRKTADLAFRQCLHSLGIARWRANIMFYAVRGFGIAKLIFQRQLFKRQIHGLC